MREDEAVLPNRRDVSVKTIYGLTSLLGVAVCAPMVRYLAGSAVQPETGWVDAGAVNSIAEGQPVRLPVVRVHRDGWRVTAEQDTVWAVKQDGALRVFSSRCTHLGCAYHWEQAKDAFVCPCHGSSFAKSGEVLAGPAPRALDRLVTKIEGDRLWIAEASEAEGEKGRS